MKNKIIIISDSHSDNSFLKLLEDNYYDFKIHAGDHLNSIEFMNSYFDWYVDGNNDWGNNFIQIFNIDNKKIMLVHGDTYNIKSYAKDGWNSKLKEKAQELQADIVIFGHIHIPIIYKEGNITYINPGSTSKPRSNNIKTYVELIIENSIIKAEIRQL